MKRFRGFIIVLYVFLTVLVLIIQPAMHKPVVLENTAFKIKEQLLHPQKRVVSDFEVKVKFTRSKPVIAKTQDKTIHIKPDDSDDKRVSFDLTSSERIQNTTMQFEDNVSSNIKDVNFDVRTSADKYVNQNIDVSSGAVLYTEREIRSNAPSASEINIDMQTDMGEIPQSDTELSIKDDYIKLKDSDEVGNKKFKASKEELIAWNVWRSNLQNRIMDDSAVDAPVGTLILFAFDVSADGRITNLEHKCSNKAYAVSAKNDMVSLLKSLEGDPVLEFPANTKRRKVRFKGGFLLDYTTQYSSPSDYSDYERVRL